MGEEARKMYQEYLNDKLDLVFNDNGLKEIANPFKDSFQHISQNSNNMTILFKQEIIDGNIYLLDYNNEKFSNEYFDEIGESSHYYVIVKRNGKCNILNLQTRKLVSNEWFDKIGSLDEYLNENLVLVKNESKHNLLDLKMGKTIENGWHDYIVGSFGNGYIEVLKYNVKDFSYQSNLMDKNGHLYFAKFTKYSTLKLLKNGLVMAGNSEINDGLRDGKVLIIMPDDKYNLFSLIDKKGNEFSHYVNYDSIKEYTDDIILVNDNYFVNKNLEIVNNEMYDRVEIIKSKNGNVYAIAWQNKLCDLLDSNYKKIKDKCWYIRALYDDNFIINSIDRKYYIYNAQDDTILLKNYEDFDYIWTSPKISNHILMFSGNGYKTKKIYDLRTKRLLIDDEFVDYDFTHYRDYLIVYKKINGQLKYNIIDLKTGKLLFEKWQSKITDFDDRKDFYRYKKGNKTIIKSKLQDVEIKKVLNGYILNNGKEHITLPYLPIKFYGIRFILSTDGYNYYLYDKFSKKVIREYEAGYFEYDDNFLLSGHYEEADKIEFVYNNKIIDITDYYLEKLKDLKSIKVNDNIDIQEDDSFKFSNLIEIEKRLQEEKEKNKKIKEAQKNRLKEDKIDSIKKQDETRKSEQRIIKKQYLQELLGIINKIKEMDNINIDERLNVEDFFIRKNNYLEINPLYDRILRYLDLSMLGFKNVKVSGIDFSNSNVSIMNTLFNGNNLDIGLDPQTVYGKDLSNCNFNGIYISPWVNFKGVNIKGASFSCDFDIKTLDIINPTIKDAIYDENTTYNGEPLEVKLVKCKKR